MNTETLSEDPVLLSHRLTLQALCRSIAAFHSEIGQDAYLPPIIDRAADYSEPQVAGLAKFESLCRKELAHHDYLSKTNRSVDNLSSNTSYLLTVWKEVLAAPKPVVALNTTVEVARDVPPLKLDVISANGNRWHKINTIQASRLLSELQQLEIGTEESSMVAENAESKWRHVTLVRQCLDMGMAAKFRSEGIEAAPRLSYRLSRMDETITEPRVQALYKVIRSLGIDLQFGDPIDATPDEGAPEGRAMVLPTLDLNFDLSLLIALLSDITHADLPSNDAETEARYQPVPRIWKRTMSRLDGQVIQDRPAIEGELGTKEHTRALTIQLKQEMQSGLIDELSTTIETMCRVHNVSQDRVRFWTTQEAMDRCQEIIRKIAGPRETYRATYMFGDGDLNGGISPFWTGSRHQPMSGPMRAFSIGILEDAPCLELATHSCRSFGRRLETTCRLILEAEGDPEVFKKALARKTNPTTRRVGHHAPPPKVPSAHTTRSMLSGVILGMTTVTANRMSVKQIVRNMGLQGLEEEDDLASFLVVEPKTLAEQKRTDAGLGRKESVHEPDPKTATLWVTEPRSLSETYQGER